MSISFNLKTITKKLGSTIERYNINTLLFQQRSFNDMESIYKFNPNTIFVKAILHHYDQTKIIPLLTESTSTRSARNSVKNSMLMYLLLHCLFFILFCFSFIALLCNIPQFPIWITYLLYNKSFYVTIVTLIGFYRTQVLLDRYKHQLNDWHIHNRELDLPHESISEIQSVYKLDQPNPKFYYPLNAWKLIATSQDDFDQITDIDKESNTQTFKLVNINVSQEDYCKISN